MSPVMSFFSNSYEIINNDQNIASRVGVEEKNRKKVTCSSRSFEWAPIRRENSEGRQSEESVGG